MNSAEDGGGMALFEADGVMGDLPRNGQWDRARATPPAFALSRTGRAPARWITWFQANEACRASGKRLPTGDEWLAAARGTVDPGANDGRANTNCNTMGSGARNAAGGAGCFSGAGAQDMIGNVWELTSDWAMSAGSLTSSIWPSEGDTLYNISSVLPPDMRHAPAVVCRGGENTRGTASGLNATLLDFSPVDFASSIGFRCVVPR